MDGIFYAKAAACIGAAFATGIGILGVSVSQGVIAMKSCENIGKYPESANNIRNTMFLSMAIVETCALWSCGIAGALIYIAFIL